MRSIRVDMPSEVELCVLLCPQSYTGAELKSQQQAREDLLKLLACQDKAEDDAIANFDENELYTLIRPTGNEASYDKAVPGLKAKLRPFQVCCPGCPAIPEHVERLHLH